MRTAAAAVARAGIPVLAITGGWSPSFDAAGALAAQLTNGRHTIVRSPNHFPQLADAERFNVTLDAFLREVEATPRDASAPRVP
jgi:pimeloyl-ACP methyl ester carboxylesterase